MEKEQYCEKHRMFRPCQECTKEDIWQGEIFIFKRDAEKRITELEQEVERLSKENDMLRGRIEWFQEEFEVDIHNRSAKVERLRSALEKYGRHLNDCPFRWRKAGPGITEIDLRCTCGLEQALSAV